MKLLYICVACLVLLVLGLIFDWEKPWLMEGGREIMWWGAGVILVGSFVYFQYLLGVFVKLTDPTFQKHLPQARKSMELYLNKRSWYNTNHYFWTRGATASNPSEEDVVYFDVARGHLVDSFNGVTGNGSSYKLWHDATWYARHALGSSYTRPLWPFDYEKVE